MLEALISVNNYVSGAGSNSTNMIVGGSSECERDSGNDHATNQVGGARPRQTRASRENRQSGLGPWTQALREVVQCKGATHRAIKVLKGRFESHMNDPY